MSKSTTPLLLNVVVRAYDPNTREAEVHLG